MTIAAIPGGVRLLLHVQPGASTTEVTGLHGDRIKVRVAAPPVEGRANAVLVAWLAERIGVPRRAVSVMHGELGRRKTVDVMGVNVAEVERLLRLES